MIDVKELIDGIHGYVGLRLKPLADRIKAIEDRPPPKDGEDGKSITVDDVRPLIDEVVRSIPAPKDGEDGSSVALEDVLPALTDVVRAATIDAA